MTTKEFFAGVAKVAICVVAGAAATGVAPLDRGQTLKNLGNAVNSCKSGIFYEIDKWAKKK